MGLLRPDFMLYDKDLSDTKMYKDLSAQLYLTQLQISNFYDELAAND